MPATRSKPAPDSFYPAPPGPESPAATTIASAYPAEISLPNPAPKIPRAPRPPPTPTPAPLHSPPPDLLEPASGPRWPSPAPPRHSQTPLPAVPLSPAAGRHPADDLPPAIPGASPETKASP